MYHFDSEQNVSGTHEREILPHLQPVIFRDGFVTELKHQCATFTRSKILKKSFFPHHSFQILFPWIPNSRKRMKI